MSLRRYLAGCAILGLACSSAWAQDALSLSVTSKATRVTFMELYTSEGCSSCPPAEKWLNSLKTRDDLWSDFVAVAFHVDYWNDLGWKDRLASPVFTHRQRKYRAEWEGRYLYTPCVARNGLEWPHWRKGASPTASTNEVGKLSIDYRDNTLRMEWSPVRRFAKSYDVYVALIGFGVTSVVSSGENTGRTLEHDFVVLQYAQRRVKQRKGVLYDRMTLDAAVPANVSERALVVWVTENRSVYPLQAVGGMLRSVSDD